MINIGVSGLCCNEEKKAKQRVVYANTNLPKNYYTTHKQYLRNRAKLFEQQEFHFNNQRTNAFYAIVNPNSLK